MLLREVFCLVCARFDASHPGVVFAKSASDSNVEAFQLFPGNGNLPQEPPPPIVSAGLDKERQWYLYKNFRQYVLEPWQDVMCPLPKEQGPNSADEEIPQRPLVGMDTNLPVIVSKKALQSTGDTDCVDIEAGRGMGHGRACGKGRGRGKSEIVGLRIIMPCNVLETLTVLMPWLGEVEVVEEVIEEVLVEEKQRLSVLRIFIPCKRLETLTVLISRQVEGEGVEKGLVEADPNNFEHFSQFLY